MHIAFLFIPISKQKIHQKLKQKSGLSSEVVNSDIYSNGYVNDHNLQYPPRVCLPTHRLPPLLEIGLRIFVFNLCKNILMLIIFKLCQRSLCCSLFPTRLIKRIFMLKFELVILKNLLTSNRLVSCYQSGELYKTSANHLL